MVVAEAPGGKEVTEETGVRDRGEGDGVGVNASVGIKGESEEGGLVIVLDAGEAGEEAPPMRGGGVIGGVVGAVAGAVVGGADGGVQGGSGGVG